MINKLRQFSISLGMAAMVGGAAHAQLSEPTTLTPLDARFGAEVETEKLKRALEDPQGQAQIDKLAEGGSKFMTLFGNGQNIKALSVPTLRLNKLTDDLTKRVVGESRTDQSALFELRSSFAGRDIVRDVQQFFNASNLGVKLSTPSAKVSQLKLNESFALALERARAQGLLLNIEQLQMLPASSRLTDLAKGHPNFSGFSASYGQTIGDLRAAVDVGTAQAKETFIASAGATRQSFIDDWSNLRRDPEARRLAVLSLDALSRQSALKAVYGVNSSFEPESYRNIYRESLRAVQISAAGGQKICSGLSLDGVWVLTAGHCFAGRSWTGMRVQFPNKDGALGPMRRIKQQFPEPAPGSLSSDPIDYVLIRVEPELPVDGSPPVTVEEKPQVCLLGAALDYETPVIVIGYVGNAKLVYDHANVWFPSQVSEETFKEIAAMTGARLQRLGEAFYPNSPTNLENFVQTNLTSFDQAYATWIGAGANAQRQYRSNPHGVKGIRPLFGFDTDTRSGNSGGPVYAREGLCVAGVFGGGMSDNVMIAEATWKEHEFATPMPAILADLDARDPSTIADPNDRAEIVAFLVKLKTLVQ